MSRIEPHMTEALKGHTLHQILQGESFNAFYLKKPGEGRMMSTLLTFTPEGIVIQGDLTPGRNGNLSVGGYGLGWFAGELSESYLCEKFLSKRFSPKNTEEAIQETLVDQQAEGRWTQEQAQALWEDRPQGDEADERSFYDFITDRLGGDCEDLRSDYDPGEAGWLCAIQQRFATLYHQQEQA